VNGSTLALGLTAALAAAALSSRKAEAKALPGRRFKGVSSLAARGAKLTAEVRRRSRRRARGSRALRGGDLSEEMDMLLSTLDFPDPQDRALEMAYQMQGVFRDSLEAEGWGDLSELLAEGGDVGEVVDLISERDGGWMLRWAENAELTIMRDDPADAPSFLFFGTPRVMRDAWMVHFTDRASDIENEGFTRGIREPMQLGLTTHFGEHAKSQPGYVFGYLPEDVRRYGWGRDARPKYGGGAVVFRADAVVAMHYTDEEQQAISWGPEAKDIRQICLGEGRRPGLPGEHRSRAGIQVDYDEHDDCTYFRDFGDLVAFLDAAGLTSRKGHADDKLLRALGQGALAAAGVARRAARQVVPAEISSEAKRYSKKFRDHIRSWEEMDGPIDELSAYGSEIYSAFDGLVLGWGSERIALASSDPRLVIKVALRPGANLDEAHNWLDAGPSTKARLVPVVAFDPKGHWLIMERVTPCEYGQGWERDEGMKQACRWFEDQGLLDVRLQNLSTDLRLLDYGEPVTLKGSPARRATPQLELPSVFYHGAPRADLRTLKPSSSGALGPGIYLATESREALRWARLRAQVGHAPTVFRVRVEINRPYLWQPEDGAQHPNLVNARVRRQGYDAIVRRTMDDSIPELIVFSADQIVWMAKS